MTLFGITVEPWAVRAVVVCGSLFLVVAFFAYMGARDRERNDREFERKMRGGR